MPARFPRDAEDVLASIPRLPPLHAPLIVRHHAVDRVTDVRIGRSRCVAHIDLGALRYVEYDRRGRICGFELLATRAGVFVDDLPYAEELLVALVAHDVPVILDTTAPPDPVRPSFGPGCVFWVRDPVSTDGRGVIAQVTDERETDERRVVVRYTDRRSMGHEPWELHDDAEMARSETDRTGAILSYDAAGALRRVIVPTPHGTVLSLAHLPYGQDVAERLARTPSAGEGPLTGCVVAPSPPGRPP